MDFVDIREPPYLVVKSNIALARMVLVYKLDNIVSVPDGKYTLRISNGGEKARKFEYQPMKQHKIQNCFKTCENYLVYIHIPIHHLYHWDIKFHQVYKN